MNESRQWQHLVAAGLVLFAAQQVTLGGLQLMYESQTLVLGGTRLLQGLLAGVVAFGLWRSHSWGERRPRSSRIRPGAAPRGLERARKRAVTRPQRLERSELER